MGAGRAQWLVGVLGGPGKCSWGHIARDIQLSADCVITNQRPAAVLSEA